MHLNNEKKILSYILPFMKSPIVIDGESLYSPVNKIQIGTSFFNTDSCQVCGECCVADDSIFMQFEYDIIQQMTPEEFRDSGKIYSPEGFDPTKTKSYTINERGQIIKNIMGCIWFTNLDIRKRHEDLDLVCKFSPEEYPKYDNYNAIDVSRVQDIPFDYEGIMGVPDTILGQFNPDQFEIIGLGCGDLGKQAGVSKNYRGRTDLAYTKNGKSKCPYSRILIRNKKPKTI